MYFVIPVIILVVTGLILYPLFQRRKIKNNLQYDYDSETLELLRRKELCYTAIRDLEFDYQTGKLSDEDFKKLYNLYKSEALRIIQRLEDEKTLSTESLESNIERAIERKRKELFHPQEVTGEKPGNDTTACPYCGIDNSNEAVFCRECGKRIGIRCPSCGTVNIIDGKFCRICGKNL